MGHTADTKRRIDAARGLPEYFGQASVPFAIRINRSAMVHSAESRESSSE